MISDPFQIAYNRIISVDLSRIWHIHLACHKWNDIFGYAFIEEINIFFSLRHFFAKFLIILNKRVKRVAYIFRHHISHSVNFITNLWHCHRAVADRIGRFKRTDIFQAKVFIVCLFAVRKNANRYIRHMCSKRKKQQCRHDIKDCMGICDLRHRISGRHRFDPCHIRRHKTDHRK